MATVNSFKKILDFPDEKKIDFWRLFLEDSKTVFKTFLAQLGPILDAPLPSQKVVKN